MKIFIGKNIKKKIFFLIYLPDFIYSLLDHVVFMIGHILPFGQKLF